MRLLWRVLTRLLRRIGWGALLVPVAAMGIAVFGVSLWTIAAVVAALVVAVRLPTLAADLLPATMAGMGAGGLVAAARIPGGPVHWAVARFVSPAGMVKSPYLTGPPRPGLSGPAASKMAEAWLSHHAAGLPGRAAPPSARPASQVLHLHAGSLAGPFTHGLGLWQGRLLVPVCLLMLTLGLWLVPRTLARWRAASQVSDLKAWLRENRWGVLLVPVAVIGVAVFGVHPWTVAGVVAAFIIVVRWPTVAADLVPAALLAFAVYGFVIAARWQSLPVGTPGPARMYGTFLVAGRQTALLAGAEASAFLAAGAWLVPRTIGAHLRTLLGSTPDPDLAGRVQRLTESRNHALDAAAAELRRIERDLHDGAQARLVALGMNLRAVERMLPVSPDAALALVGEARETSLRALNELRDLIRGICPPVLADRGLGHAVRALALDTPLPTELDIDLPGRPGAPVESACYFAIAEALANAVRHSGARRVHIRIQHTAGILRIEVTDDGVGGADPARGSGLQGVERRLGTFDGIMAVNSPPGGPTVIAMEVPCALSSPKTSSC